MMSSQSITWSPAASATVASALSLVESEARALLVRLGRVRPFALQQTMVPAAALPPALLSAIDRYLIGGRRKVRQMVLGFIRWLRSPAGHASSPEVAQRRFSMLRMRFNVALAQLDIFAAGLAQRAGHANRIWPAGTGSRPPPAPCPLPSLLCTTY